MSFVDFAKLRDAIQIQSPAATDGLEGVASEAAPVASPAEYDALDAALCALKARQDEVLAAGGDGEAPFVVDEALAAQIQSFLEVEPLDLRAEDGLEAMYDSRDIRGWVKSFFTWRRGKGRHPGKWDPGPPVRIPNNARVALLGDWGTGRYGAVTCAATIERTLPAYDVLIHLGDVYYSGTRDEIERNFLARWPRVPGAVSRACNSNHEMYSGGFGYYDVTLPRFEQPASYFCLENDHYRILGLDTGYKDGDLAGEQAAWAHDLILGAGGRRVILLTHHQPFTLFRGDGSFKAIVDRLQPLFTAGRIFAWYWGHEHRCVIYDRHPTLNMYGRCIGHSGFPYFRDKLDPHPFTANADGSRWYRVGHKDVPTGQVLDGENRDMTEKAEKYGPNGFASLELMAGGILERVHAADGTELLHWTLR